MESKVKVCNWFCPACRKVMSTDVTECREDEETKVVYRARYKYCYNCSVFFPKIRANRNLKKLQAIYNRLENDILTHYSVDAQARTKALDNLYTSIKHLKEIIEKFQ